MLIVAYCLLPRRRRRSERREGGVSRPSAAAQMLAHVSVFFRSPSRLRISVLVLLQVAFCRLFPSTCFVSARVCQQSSSQCSEQLITPARFPFDAKTGFQLKAKNAQRAYTCLKFRYQFGPVWGAFLDLFLMFEAARAGSRAECFSEL